MKSIEYTITVDNTGNVDLTNVVLDDVFAGGATLVSGDTNANSILETTETWIYTADYVVTQADLNAGTALVNVATVDTAQTAPQQDDATSTVAQNTALTIVKDGRCGVGGFDQRHHLLRLYGDQHGQCGDRRCGGHGRQPDAGQPG